MAMAAWSEKANLLICERRRFASPVSSKRKERHCWRSRCVVRYAAVGCDAVRCVSPAPPIQRLARQAQRYLGQFALRHARQAIARSPVHRFLSGLEFTRDLG